MGTLLGLSGTIYKTASGELLNAGDKIRVYDMHIISGAGGDGVVELINGGAGGDVWVMETGATSEGRSFSYSNGFLFTNGCYVNIDANVVSVVITCWKEVK